MAKQKEQFIQEAIKRPGALTKKAEKRGLTPLEFAKKVVANPEQYDELTVRQARFALLLNRLRPR